MVARPELTGVRHYCRNPRCRSKLPAPIEIRNYAFCTRACHSSFYRHRCVVCERHKRSEKAGTCGRKCRAEQRRLPNVFPLAGQYPCRRRADSINPQKTGVKIAPTSRRAWRRVAGPDPPEINFRVPLDRETASRVRRANEKARQAGSRSFPFNLIGGHRWPGASIDSEAAAEILAAEISTDDRAVASGDGISSIVSPKRQRPLSRSTFDQGRPNVPTTGALNRD